MAFEATIKIEDKVFVVRDCFCSITQKTDFSGSPVAGVVGGVLVLIMDGTDDDTFGEWMADPTKRHDGEIIFYKQANKPLKKIEFKDAYATELIESYISREDSSLEKLPMMSAALVLDIERYNRIMACHYRNRCNYLIYLRISAEKIKLDGVAHDNRWG